MAKVMIIDCQLAGIAGDMFTSSLVDAGANKGKVIEAVFACQNFFKGSKITKVSFEKTIIHGFSATQLQIRHKDRVNERKGAEMQRALASCCDSLGLEQKAKIFALESLKTIISAEAKIHGEDFSNVHLHEASSIDTLADLVGSAMALQDLKLFDARVFSTSVAIGGGLLEFSHGIVPNPASAILEIFKGKEFTIAGGPVEEEITTPTGAAMLVNLAQRSIKYYPSISVEKLGYGAGTKKFKELANVMRVVVGTSSIISEVDRDTVCIIETNIDDTSGEIVGNLIERMTEVSKDVTVLQGITKKSRPTYLIRIISDQSQLNNVLEILFSESGTMGARIQEVERFVLPRAVLIVPVKINDNTFNIHVKIVKDSVGRVTNFKPEFEDIRIIASRCQISAKRAKEMVNAEIMQKVGTTHEIKF